MRLLGVLSLETPRREPFACKSVNQTKIKKPRFARLLGNFLAARSVVSYCLGGGAVCGFAAGGVAGLLVLAPALGLVVAGLAGAGTPD